MYSAIPEIYPAGRHCPAMDASNELNDSQAGVEAPDATKGLITLPHP